MVRVRQFFKKILKPYEVQGILPNILLLLPRVIMGCLLTFIFSKELLGTPWADEGLELLQVAPWFVEKVSNFGIPFSLMPKTFAWSAGFTTAMGGILLIMGANTRITAFFIICMMLITILFRAWDGSWDILPVFSFFCFGLFFLGFGAGKYSFDYYFSRYVL
ncbi:DoxX family protein [Maribacter aurantiacus]|uniref:DoxX family protein n=1 Tax=Maribacter aurantiacus TaxID=1882343 RepID=A0A5R8M479_9FLAO|nr:DoxX family protein [Maribacter aurantiacus]TLF44345.1 DoxX family protein [Maribacter aurantiacus]